LAQVALVDTLKVPPEEFESVEVVPPEEFESVEVVPPEAETFEDFVFDVPPFDTVRPPCKLESFDAVKPPLESLVVWVLPPSPEWKRS
jgi:hypothetical protein